MKEKIERKYKELQEEMDIYVSDLVNGHLYTEEYATKRIMEVKIQIWLLEELLEDEEV